MNGIMNGRFQGNLNVGPAQVGVSRPKDRLLRPVDMSKDRSKGSRKSGFHAEVEECLRQVIAKTVRPTIVEAIEAKYVDRLSVVGPIRRIWIRMQMNRAIKRGVTKAVDERMPSDDSLFFSN